MCIRMFSSKLCLSAECGLSDADFPSYKSEHLL